MKQLISIQTARKDVPTREYTAPVFLTIEDTSFRDVGLAIAAFEQTNVRLTRCENVLQNVNKLNGKYFSPKTF